MNQFAYVLVSAVSIFLGLEQLLMLARAVFSWFQPDDDNKIYTFLYYVTEPLIVPVRAVLERFEFFGNTPFDFSFTIAWLLLSVIQALLPRF